MYTTHTHPNTPQVSQSILVFCFIHVHIPTLYSLIIELSTLLQYTYALHHMFIEVKGSQCKYVFCALLTLYSDTVLPLGVYTVLTQWYCIATIFKVSL